MRTIDFKIWLLCLFLATASIKVDRQHGYTAAMNGKKEITNMPGCDYQDGDMLILSETGAEWSGYIWRYDNNGHFTNVSYPWWYTGNKPGYVNTIVVR